MKAYYYQIAGILSPIYGVNSFEEAARFCNKDEPNYIVESSEKVYMNTETGSVDFASGWEDLSQVVEVTYSAELEYWVEV